MSFAQSSATVIIVYCPSQHRLRWLGIAGSSAGPGQRLAACAAPLPSTQWKGPRVWSQQQQRGRGNPGSACKYNCRGCRLWWGAEPKRNREPRLSWQRELARARGCLLVHRWWCLAALRLPQLWGHSRRSRRLVSLPKGEMCVGCFTVPGLSSMWQQGPGLCSARGGVSPPYSLRLLQAVLALPF